MYPERRGSDFRRRSAPPVCLPVRCSLGHDVRLEPGALPTSIAAALDGVPGHREGARVIDVNVRLITKAIRWSSTRPESTERTWVDGFGTPHTKQLSRD